MSEPPPSSGTGAISDAASAFGVLADHERFKVISAIAVGASTLAEVADATGLTTPVIHKAISRLMGAELVEEESGIYRVRFEELARIARAAASERRSLEQGPEGAGQVVGRFFRGGKLTSIPTTRSKRLVVLDYLAQRFEPGRLYSEKQVSDELAEVHEDYAALRRYLVDHGFLERKDGRYWRSGGTFLV